MTLPDLPRIVYDRSGNRIDPSLPVWPVHDPSALTSIEWAVCTHLHGSVLKAFKLYICDRFERVSPMEALNAFGEIRAVTSLVRCNLHSLSDLDLTFFETCRAALRKGGGEYRLHRVRAWFTWMADMGFPGSDESVVHEVAKWRIPGNQKGVAVLTRDTSHGPLGGDDYALLLRALREDSTKSIEVAAVMLCVELGLNPKSIVLLEERDLHRFSSVGSNDETFQLDVPRIKKRQSSRDTRRRSISVRLGRVLSNVISENDARLGRSDGRRLIFCALSPEPPAPSAGVTRAYPIRSMQVTELVRSFAISRGLRSHGSGKLLHLTPRRLRYTFATRMAEQGVPAAILADLLDHTDLQNVMVYVNSRAEAVDRLDGALERDAGPVFRRFMGTVVNRHEGSPSNEVMGERRMRPSLGGIGRCGRSTFCNLYPPYSCYLCGHFQACRDGPHRELLNDMVEYREFLATVSDQAANRIPYQLDEVIQAVREVVERQAPNNDVAGSAEA